MKRVLFFTDKISTSGASKIITWVVNNVNIKDAKVSLVTYLPLEDQRQIIENVSRTNLSVQCESKIKRSLIVVKELRKIFKREKTDLCIAFLPMESLYAILAAVGLKTKVIVCERSDPYLESNRIVSLARYMFRFADGAVFQTEGARAYFPTLLQKRSVVIPNPAFRRNDFVIIPYQKRRNVVSYSGRLYIKQKRQDVLLKAFKKLIEKGHNLELIIYGDGPDRSQLVKLTKELGISGFVEFAGNVANVEELIGDSKMMVLTSDYEGIPNVIIEALQSGVPVVSTDCSPGGARVLIQNGVNGYIVQRGDYVALADKMEYLLNNNEIAQSMANKAIDITITFNEHDIIDMWRDYIYRFLLHN